MKKNYYKRIYFIYFLWALLLCTSCNSKINTSAKSNSEVTTASNSSVISPIEFQEKITSGKGILLDVRTPKEYQEEHLNKALLINVLDDSFVQEINGLDKSQPIYLYCRSGKRSAKAAQILRENGFDNIFDLQGGIKAWKEAQLPTVKEISHFNQ